MFVDLVSVYFGCYTNVEGMKRKRKPKTLWALHLFSKAHSQIYYKSKFIEIEAQSKKKQTRDRFCLPTPRVIKRPYFLDDVDAGRERQSNFIDIDIDSELAFVISILSFPNETVSV